jgi:hypothetical protein
VLLLQLLCVGIELEAAFSGSPENGIPGLLADIGLIVQNTGDRAHRVAGLGGKIFNRQDGHLQGCTEIDKLAGYIQKLHIIIQSISIKSKFLGKFL